MVSSKKGESGSKDSGDPWVVARKYANLYGSIPSSFSTLIRTLVADHQKDGEYSFSSKWQLNRLLRSESMKAPIYFALKTHQKRLCEEKVNITTKELASAFKPIDLAALLGVLYLYRRARHLCDPNEWKFMAPISQTRAEIGGFVGVAMENVGFSLGLLAGCMRSLAMVCFHLDDANGFMDYRRQLKVKKANYTLSHETKKWGCTHIQIASNLIVGLGLGTNMADVVCQGYEMEQLTSEMVQIKGYAVRVSELWIDSLVSSGLPPDIVHSGYYYPLKDALKELLTEAGLTAKNGTQFAWLEKGKESINPKEMPGLFEHAEAAPSQAAPGQQEDLASDVIEDLEK